MPNKFFPEVRLFLSGDCHNNSGYGPSGENKTMPGKCSKVEKLCADLVWTWLPSQAIGLAMRVGGQIE